VCFTCVCVCTEMQTITDELRAAYESKLQQLKHTLDQVQQQHTATKDTQADTQAQLHTHIEQLQTHIAQLRADHDVCAHTESHLRAVLADSQALSRRLDAQCKSLEQHLAVRNESIDLLKATLLVSLKKMCVCVWVCVGVCVCMCVCLWDTIILLMFMYTSKETENRFEQLKQRAKDAVSDAKKRMKQKYADALHTQQRTHEADKARIAQLVRAECEAILQEAQQLHHQQHNSHKQRTHGSAHKQHTHASGSGVYVDTHTNTHSDTHTETHTDTHTGPHTDNHDGGGGVVIYPEMLSPETTYELVKSIASRSQTEDDFRAIFRASRELQQHAHNKQNPHHVYVRTSAQQLQHLRNHGHDHTHEQHNDDDNHENDSSFNTSFNASSSFHASSFNASFNASFASAKTPTSSFQKEDISFLNVNESFIRGDDFAEDKHHDHEAQAHSQSLLRMSASSMDSIKSGSSHTHRQASQQTHSHKQSALSSPKLSQSPPRLAHNNNNNSSSNPKLPSTSGNNHRYSPKPIVTISQAPKLTPVATITTTTHQSPPTARAGDGSKAGSGTIKPRNL
jgi:F0F1-type ATP synthase membrane subunit b/b'